LLIEAGMPQGIDACVVACGTPEQQLERLRARGMSETEARRRIAPNFRSKKNSSAPPTPSICSGTLDETRAQVQALAVNLLKRQTT